MAGALLEASKTVLLVFAALFPIVNPLGVAPIFLMMTGDAPERVRRRLATRVALNGFLLLVASVFVGSHILRFFGITLPVVQVGGGLLVTVSGWKILTQEGAPKDRRAAAGVEDDRLVLDRAFYPLTLPLTVGPGSIAVAITLGSTISRAAADGGRLLDLAAAGAGLGLIAATIYLSFRFAGGIGRLLGQAGTNVFIRLTAFILVCIGIQITWNGLSALVGPLVGR
jgi:multiple antibiotic resistance protein